MESDEGLMRQIQAGDETALDALLRRYRPRLYGFLARRADPAEADDLFQETWIRVVRYRDRFDPRRRFSTWLFQIANNLCRDRVRRRDAERRMKERAASHADVVRDLRTPGPDTRMDMAARVAALPERLREVLLLRYFEAFSEAEIAAAVGIPRGTVKSRLHTAVRALRQQIAEEEEAHGH